MFKLVYYLEKMIHITTSWCVTAYLVVSPWVSLQHLGFTIIIYTLRTKMVFTIEVLPQALIQLQGKIGFVSLELNTGNE